MVSKEASDGAAFPETEYHEAPEAVENPCTDLEVDTNKKAEPNQTNNSEVEPKTTKKNKKNKKKPVIELSALKIKNEPNQPNEPNTDRTPSESESQPPSATRSVSSDLDFEPKRQNTANRRKGSARRHHMILPVAQAKAQVETPSQEKFEVLPARDFIMRRIEANICSKESEREESAFGLLELRQNFDELRENRQDHPKAFFTLSSDVDWEFWAQVVHDYASVAKRDPQKVKKAIHLGFPPGLRGLLWQVISSSKSSALEQYYSGIVDVECVLEKSISKDIQRTSMVQQVDADILLRILRAYSLFDPEVGYTQGMAFIAVPLMLAGSLSEYEVFCLFVRMMKAYNFRSLFLNEMPGLHLKLHQFDRLLEDMLEPVYIHLKRQGVLSTMYASQWFLTLFAYKFPADLVLRIFDIVIAEGYEAALRFAVALMNKNSKRILQLQFDDLLPFLKDQIFESYLERPGDLVRDAESIELTPQVLARYELEYQEIHRVERERAQQMDALRTSNARLTSQVRSLEDWMDKLNREHVEVARKMIQLGMDKAQIEHEKEELLRELKAYKQMTLDQKDILQLTQENLELKEARHRLEEQIEALQIIMTKSI